MTGAWLEFWDGARAPYINARHKDVHFRLIAHDIAQLVPFPHARVLDYGCGEALHADIVAAAAGELVLCEAAPQIRARLTARFDGNELARRNPKIRVIPPEERERLPEHSIDLIVLHSVIQYLSPNDTQALFSSLRRLLQPNGRLIIGDVISAQGHALERCPCPTALRRRERIFDGHHRRSDPSFVFRLPKLARATGSRAVRRKRNHSNAKYRRIRAAARV